MNETDIQVFIAEIRKDISYIKERVTEKFARYDEVTEQVMDQGNRLTKVETSQNVQWFLITVVVVGGVVLGLWIKYATG